jgi:hypothetical protein
VDKHPISFPLYPLDGQRISLIACATVIEEMLPFLPPTLPYEVLDFGLHLHPGDLKSVLQEKIILASQQADVLLLGYGLCSMAVVGLKATTATLVIPKVDDCIGIFLGSCQAYQDQSRQEPGTYYLTKGWIEVGDSPFDEFKRMAERYGEERALRMVKLLLRNYKRLAFINTGQYDIDRYLEHSHKLADQFNLRFEQIEGSPDLVKKMVFGPWDDQFVVVEPGQTVQYEYFHAEVPA